MATSKIYILFNGVKTEIEEPVGWDGLELKMQRNEKSHGIGIEISDSNLEFYDPAAMSILRGAYSADIDSVVDVIEEIDGVEVYRGRIDFLDYSDERKKEGYSCINATIMQRGTETIFFARQSQKVNMDSLEAFEGAALKHYPYLKKEMNLPAKELLLTSRMDLSDHKGIWIEGIQLTGNVDASTRYKAYIYRVPFSTQGLTEIDSIFPYQGFGSERAFNDIDNLSSLVFERGDAAFIFEGQEGFEETTTFDININMHFRAFCTTQVEPSKIDIRFLILLVGSDGNIKEELTSCSIHTSFVDPVYSKQRFLYSRSMKLGDRIICAVALQNVYNGNRPEYTRIDYIIDFLHDSSFSVQALNKTPDTAANLTFVHEALARVVEATTNGGATVKSDFYGRTDSNVNPTEGTSALSMKALTTGLRIRNALDAEGNEPMFTLSFEDIYKGLRCIDNVGYGFVTENGKLVLRIEDWTWFYSNEEVVFEVDNLSGKQTAINPDEIFSRLKVGYKKYETEGTNGLDAFLTEREYRTRSKIANNTMDMLTDFVGDAYAIEATRRLANDLKTKDWRYDNDIFIIQLRKSTTGTDGYEVESNVWDAENVISPQTLYNARISPARIANRWMSRVLGWSGKTEKLIFTSGTGNLAARTQLYDWSAMTGESDSFDNNSRKLKAERIAFECPMTNDQQSVIRRNPYGIIMVEGKRCRLIELKYRRKMSMATFTVVPEW